MSGYPEAKECQWHLTPPGRSERPCDALATNSVSGLESDGKPSSDVYLCDEHHHWVKFQAWVEGIGANNVNWKAVLRK